MKRLISIEEFAGILCSNDATKTLFYGIDNNNIIVRHKFSTYEDVIVKLDKRNKK